MAEVADSIVVKRLVRSLRYRLTYVQVLEAFLASRLHPAVVQLLNSLLETQQAAAEDLSGYLRRLPVDSEDLPVYQKLLDQAAQRKNAIERLRFIRYGLRRAVSWYKTQLTDRQMTADPELKHLLLALGEREAAGLWRTEAVGAMLGLRLEPWSKDRPAAPRQSPDRGHDQSSRRFRNTRRPAWRGKQSTIWSRSFRGTWGE
jgi:hypothetical protein